MDRFSAIEHWEITESGEKQDVKTSWTHVKDTCEEEALSHIWSETISNTFGGNLSWSLLEAKTTFTRQLKFSVTYRTTLPAQEKGSFSLKIVKQNYDVNTYAIGMDGQPTSQIIRSGTLTNHETASVWDRTICQ